MSSSQRQVKVSRNQQELIISYLNEHERFKTRQFTSTFTKEDLNAMWEDLAKKLNSDGTGPHKTVDKWKKMLADWKSNTKLKNAAIKKSRNGTGGGEKTSESLTDIEERLLAVWGKELTDGIAHAQEFGLPINPKARIIENDMTDPSSSSSLAESETSEKIGDRTKNSDIFLGLEDYEVNDIDENHEPVTSMPKENEPLPEEILPHIGLTSKAERKRRLDKDAKQSLEKRHALMNEGKSKPRNEFDKASSLIEKMQESQNTIIGEISSSLTNLVKEARNMFEQQTEMAVQLNDIVSQQKELITLKSTSNQIEMLKLAAQRKNNELMQSLLNCLEDKNKK